MSTLQIYSIYDNKNDIFNLMNKLIVAGADITIYDLSNDRQQFESNQKISRLIDAYGESILPVVVLDGEIVSVEKFPDPLTLIRITGLSAKKLQRADISIENYKNCSCNNSCNKSDSSSGCYGCNNKNSCNTCSREIGTKHNTCQEAIQNLCSHDCDKSKCNRNNEEI